MTRHHLILAVLILLSSLIACGEDPFIDFPSQPDPSFITRTNHTFDGNIAQIRGLSTSPAGLTDIPDPSHITRTNYSFDGNILPLRNFGDMYLPEGSTYTYKNTLEGVVLNDYDSVSHGVWHDKGFFIQDTNAAIFVRSALGVSVKRGDRIKIAVTSIYRSTCTNCAFPEKGRLQVKTYTIASVVSTANLIYCQDLTAPVTANNPAGGPIYIKVKGKVSLKNTATWGLDGNSWGIRIPIATEQSQSSIQVGDDVVLFGIVESYSSQVAGGAVNNQYPLWLYHTADCLFDLNNYNPTGYVEGIVTNSYDASRDGTYHNGFFIQDKNAMLFIRITNSLSGINVTLGDRVKIAVRELVTSGTKAPGQLQLKDPLPSEITLLSSGNKVYCQNISPPISTTNPSGGPQFVKIKGRVSHKTTDSSATWGLNGNSWAARIPVLSDRLFPNIHEGDEVTLYGVVDWYVMPPAGGLVTNHTVLWLYHTDQTVFDYSEPI